MVIAKSHETIVCTDTATGMITTAITRAAEAPQPSVVSALGTHPAVEVPGTGTVSAETADEPRTLEARAEEDR